MYWILFCEHTKTREERTTHAKGCEIPESWYVAEGKAAPQIRCDAALR